MFPLKTLIFVLLSFNPYAGARSISSNHIKWVDCALNVPDVSGDLTFNPSTIDLASLPSSLRCGQLEVPMDYSKPMSSSNFITLGLAVVRAAKSKGALFFNPGGTDAGVVVAWEVALNLTNAFSGLEDFDLVVMDVRGTYSSNPLDVSLNTFAGLSGPYPTSQSQHDLVRAASKVVIQSWIDNSSPPGIIQHLGTREVVQDYESIRKALGYNKINFVGASYGSFRAAQYAAKYPKRVGRFVLDAAVPHGRSLFEQAQDSIAALDRAMLRIDAYCQNNSSCPFHFQGKGSIQNAFNDILAKAAKKPYQICANPDDCFSVGPLDIQSALEGLLLGSPDFPMIIQGLKTTISSDDVSLFVSPPPTVSALVAMPILCNDYDYDRSFTAFNKSLSQGLKDDTSGIGMVQSWQIQLFCSGWEFPVAQDKPLPQTDARMLIVTADFDASAPTEWATFAWKQAPKSALVVRHGDDHVSFPLADQESTRITKKFLNTGDLPRVQCSRSVSVYLPGMIRAPISDPYEVPTGVGAGDVDSGTLTVEIPF